MIQPNKIMKMCGAEEVTRQEVIDVITPEPEGRHYPMPHITYLNQVENNLRSVGFQVSHEEHALSHEGNRYFGVLQLSNEGPSGDYHWLLALRNSHDKSFSAGIAAGNRVTVCDNLMFNGQIVIRRKHTKNVEKDFNNLVFKAVGMLGDKLVEMDTRIDAYKQKSLTDDEAASVILNAATKYNAVSMAKAGDVWSEWLEPEHEEFSDKTAWSLMNAFTECAKGLSLNTQINRGQTLTGIFDGLCGVSFAEPDVIEV
jgi:hypothetical protein